jgi:hypothetical protein
LGFASLALAWMEKCSYRCQTRNRCCLASSRFPLVLAFSITFKGPWQAQNYCRASICNPADDRRKCATWGAPRIHGELLKLGFEVSEGTVSRYLCRLSPSDQARKLWATFLLNHREVIAAMDFFTVPTITFRVLYCFFVIEHGRRKILHFNVTEHPTSSWIAQQLREAFPEPCPYRYALLDLDSKFGKDVTDFLVSGGIKPKRVGHQCPRQNGISERWRSENMLSQIEKSAYHDFPKNIKQRMRKLTFPAINSLLF